MKKYFFTEESPYKSGYYTIRIDFSLLPKMETKGSYNLLPARLLGLSYPEYCRFCRDELGAELVGKNSMYIKQYFKRGEHLTMLVRVLNAAMEYVLTAKELGIEDESFINTGNIKFDL